MPLSTLPHVSRPSAEQVLALVREKFQRFQSLLEGNSQVLKIISDMEEKRQGDFSFDTNYLRDCLHGLHMGMTTIIDNMIALGGDQYDSLRNRYHSLAEIIESAFPGSCTVKDDFVIDIFLLDRSRAGSVGSKCAQLGEMKSKIGLPVPDGFAISGWAYHHFMTAEGLQDKIDELIKSLDIKKPHDLSRISSEIRQLVTDAPIPEELASDIRNAYSKLIKRTGHKNVAMRSSAVGEDSFFSFAGQFNTYLNVASADLLDRYRAVLTDKFTPQAIYYSLSQTTSNRDLPMGVCCMEMIDAISSGVIYTCDPVDPAEEHYIISSLYGLGKYLMEGRLTPDLFKISSRDGSLISTSIACKPFMLRANQSDGIKLVEVSETRKNLSSLDDTDLKQLYEYTRVIEEHYHTPRDIEFAKDRSGKIFLLQCRPLRTMAPPTISTPLPIEFTDRIIGKGDTVCPGVGGGPIYRANTSRDLSQLQPGCVLVIRHPLPGIVTVLGQISALVTEVGSIASHLATLAREYHVPTLTGVAALRELPAKTIVTVDATRGVIYHGLIDSLIASGMAVKSSLANSMSYHLLQSILNYISPLSLLSPTQSNFTIENCQTIHDLTRFAHQKAMDEMFASAHTMGKKWSICHRLKSDIPLIVDIIFLDQDPPKPGGTSIISENELNSHSMIAFWNGLREEGWPAQSRLGTAPAWNSTINVSLFPGENAEFSTNCYAILSREYMFLSLRMGFHFTTVEVFCTEEPNKNYIRIQYRGGGAAFDRRAARIKLLEEILSELGFENRAHGDFLDAVVAYHSCLENIRLLKILGRLTFLTKQLDMALSNEAMVQWYKGYFIRKLGI